MMTLNTVLARLREEAHGVTAVYGAAFEKLVRNLLLRAPVYRGRFVHVWRWPELGWGADTGIDLVAEDAEGKLYGIQAKCYDEATTVSKQDIDTFLSRLGQQVHFQGVPRHFDYGMVFSSTDSWSHHAEAALHTQLIPCQRITHTDLASWDINWEVIAGFSNADHVVNAKPLRDYQLEALAAAQTHYATQTRGKLIMACGTGKTLTALRILEEETGGKGLVLFLVPSIALLNQTLIAWSGDAKAPFHAICVCSDTQANTRAAQQADLFGEDPTALALPPSTNPETIAKHLRYYRTTYPNALTIIFSTYQSIEAVAKAQELLGRDAYPFDMAICDEAHRTTGVIDVKREIEPAFTHIHYDDHVLVRKRLYMTATPRLYTAASKASAAQQSIELCSMDDETLYGETFYTISFSKAVEKGCLSDYKVFVLTLPEGAFNVGDFYRQLSPDDRRVLEGRDGAGRPTAIQLMGCINALAKHLKDSPILDAQDRIPAHRAIAFCRTIALSKATTNLFNVLAKDARTNTPLRVEAQHVDGGMTTLERNRHLAWLHTEGAPDTCHLLTNVRCLSEGVDVPALDAALFLSKRNSQIDVVQSVGRVMRRSEGKRYGYIIIPVVIPEGKSPEAELDNSDTFGVVWSVLNALRSHDERFEAHINQLRFRKTIPNARPGHTSGPIIISTGEGDGDSDRGDPFPTQGLLDLRIPEEMERYRRLLFGRVVERCGNTAYFERWAADVADIAERHIARIQAICATDPAAQAAFTRYYEMLKVALPTAISEADARLMLAQQRITAPIFDALFGNNTFTAHNPVSRALDHAGALLLQLESEADQKKLAKLYDSVRTRVEGITAADAKQEIIRTLYDTFFAKAFPSVAQKLGIVFTPIEVVDFILHSANDALRTYFGKTLSDEGVHILDPFTGTGTFLARLLSEDVGLIQSKDLRRKYTAELHANEIVLLSYYIAAVNIENLFHDRQGATEHYEAFPGIILGDTFRMRQLTREETLDDGVFITNSERILAQNRAPVSVIIGNPPYSVAKGESYPELDGRIEETYVAKTNATNKNSLYDSYIKAFRWCSDRIDPVRGGLLCFVTNGAWLDGNAMDGFRKCLEKEFSSIYVFNLRGNCRTSGELRRREGDGVFGLGSRTPIAITILVKKPQATETKATIHYKDIGDYKTRETKLHDVDMYHSFLSPTWLEASQIITPNPHGDWINQRTDAFSAYIPLAPDKKFNTKAKSFFTVYSSGLKTQRDAWCYSFSSSDLRTEMQRSISHYNAMLGKPIDPDDTVINWSRALREQHRKGQRTTWEEAIRVAHYRPFQKQCLYFSRFWNEMVYQIPRLFPTGAQGENVVICISIGNKDFMPLITDCIPDLHFNGDVQAFPLYWYEAVEDDLLLGTQYVRHDGVSDWALAEARKRYRGVSLTKEDLFYYVYGTLHSPNYRTTFAADLKKSLPRLPFVERAEDFWAFSKAGRALAALHLNAESCAPYPLKEVGNGSEPRVEKLRFANKNASLIINASLALEGIPPEAYGYVVNGSAPIKWVVDRYQVKKDKVSGIINDPNHTDPELLPGIEASPARAIANHIRRLITLSLESLRLIDSLPKLI